ncbi:MAG: ferrous iron transport protein A [Acidobacteria bacterium]|nr:ferrous iron transport protein A [Acidobacteriota bacterium]
MQLDTPKPSPYPKSRVQLSFNKLRRKKLESVQPTSLADLRCGQHAVLGDLDVADDLRRRLMEMGFFPGSRIDATGCAPGGDPRIYRVDGSEIALRAETAAQIRIRPLAAAAD